MRNTLTAMVCLTLIFSAFPQGSVQKRNLMRNIQLIILDRYNDTSAYELIEEGIYRSLNDDMHNMAISFELEDQEDTQYPLEDILEKYSLYVSDFLEDENDFKGVSKIELAGDLEELQDAKSIIGKRVYNEEYRKDGKTYVKLVIE